jgi:DeoR family suf operon transcriptional repressor
MAAIHTFSSRHQALLTSLLNNRVGLSVDQLAKQQGISRNATNQHLSSLSNQGLIEYSLRPSSGGRPVKSHYLTPAGLELFPRHYALLSNLLIGWIRSHPDQQALINCLQSLGMHLASDYAVRVDKLNSLPLKISEVAVILTELGYVAGTYTSDDGASGIVANNCIFHQVASDCEQVCELDLSLMGTLLNARIDHQECMVRGGLCCRFGITPE